MFVLRVGALPLRTRDAGKTWQELRSFGALVDVSFGFELSWSGKTIVVHGVDPSKIAQGEKAVFVWRSVSDPSTPHHHSRARGPTITITSSTRCQPHLHSPFTAPSQPLHSPFTAPHRTFTEPNPHRCRRDGRRG